LSTGPKLGKENDMAKVTREKFNKTDNDRAYVEAEGNRKVETKIAESFTIEDDGENWVLVTVLKQIS
jgi:hypothetical protein